jgi:regulator of sigma E protease
MAAQLILGLSIIVALHELGHYLAARAFGIRVEKFYLFFDAWGFKLFSIRRGDTEYGIGWLPLGGYVKIAGMIDESLDTSQLKQEPQPWEFRSKPAWQRLIVMVAGVVVNAILGVIIFSFVLLNYNKSYLPNDEITEGVYAYEMGRELGFKTGDRIVSVNGKGVERFMDVLSTRVFFGSEIVVERDGKQTGITVPDDFYRTVSRSGRMKVIDADNHAFSIDSVLPGRGAEKAGLMAGDTVVSLNGLAVPTWGSFTETIGNSKGDTLVAVVSRNGATMSLPLYVDSTGIVGVFSSPKPHEMRHYTLGSALKYGIKDAVDLLTANIKGLGKIFAGKEKATDSLQGPIGIARIYGGEWLWSKFWFITGLISIILAFMNILPIPALDGGHVIFLTIEAVTGRKFSDKFMEKAQIAGMVILLALMVFVVGNDIFKLFR